MNNLLESAPPQPEVHPIPRQAPPHTTALFILLAGTLVTGLILQQPDLCYCPNDGSRWNTVYYLVEHQTYEWKPDHGALWPGADRSVDPLKVPETDRDKLYKAGDKYYREVWGIPPFWTIDMVQIDGKYYSSKPPLLPTLLAGVGWTIGQVAQVDFSAHPWFIIRGTLLVVQVLPLLLGIWLIARHVERVTTSPWARWFCVAAAALGTYLTAYTVTLNNHVIGAWCVLIALYAWMRIWYERREEWYWFVLVGFFASLFAANEMPGAPLAAMLLGLTLLRKPRKTLVWMLVPALVPVAAFLLTNYLATGSWRPVYSRFGDVGGPYDYPGSYWPPRGQPSGVDALHEHWAVYMANLLIGHHGFFLLTPVFLVSLLGVARNLRGGEHRPLLAATVLGATAYLACFYTFYTHESRNYGGTDQGARWMFWLIPLWLLFLPAGAEKLGSSRIGRVACYVCLAVSVFSAAFAVHQPWSESWAHLLFRQVGWINY